MATYLDDENTPYASNTSTAQIAYEQRRLYDEKSYPKEGPEPIDCWYEKLLYGRVDEKGRAIYLDELNLKQIANSKNDKTLFAFDFVVDAFQDFLAYYQKALITGCDPCDGDILIKDGMLGLAMGAHKAFENKRSMHVTYQEYMNDLYVSFSRNFMASFENDKKIKDFDSFLKLFEQFTSNVLIHSPITKSNFVISKIQSPLISGLSIEIAETQAFGHGDDLPKYTKFITHQNFTFFRKSAKKYGFMIDKHAPWRLIADINSPKMQEYMAIYDVNRNNLFKKYYILAYKYDIDNLKAYIQGFYNSYVAALPTTKVYCSETSYGGVASGITYKTPSTKTKTITRHPISMSSINQKFDMFYWIDYYIKLRMQEFTVNWSGTKKLMKYNKLIRRVRNIQKNIDIDAAIGYINKELGVVPEHYRKIQKQMKLSKTDSAASSIFTTNGGLY